MEKNKMQNARRQLIKKIGYDAYWEIPAKQRLEMIKKYVELIYYKRAG